jgi:epoxyqueuosine reductase
MSDKLAWDEVTVALSAAGWQARVVPVERLEDVKARLNEVITGSFEHDLEAYLLKWTSYEMPAAPTARSVIVGATPRPLTQAVLTRHGEEHVIQVPPHYAGYYTTPDKLAAAAWASLKPFGYSAARFEPPLKTLAACSGLAQYGYNNIAYVDGLGSYLMLAACVSDAPPPDNAVWSQPHWMGRCSTCVACRRACPGGAITEHRLLLHTERCITLHNEHTDPLPDWILPEMHHAAVGCLRCQQACPVNKKVELVVAEPEDFDEAETAALLAGEPAQNRSPETAAKMARCGLDYSPELMARNLALLLPA